ncbi:hypothetical protein [Thiofilum flexile]|uniref:hypothetical protein n=1 Tax=Thiofilum flexile TaxID=125627 RepID=UPI000368E5FB|nr:hypothetical protein [Thiofilum flexile]
MNTTLMYQAGELAAQVYERFMVEVIEAKVLNERVGQLLTDKQKQDLHNGKIIDTRVLYLMSLSGKGGWDEDAQKRERYLKNQNITLLDHLLSVVRGAVVLCALDTAGALGTETVEAEDEQALLDTLTVVAAIAFLHDLDKMLRLTRDAPLTLEQVEQSLQRYGIREYLGEIKLNAEQIRFLIEQAEETQRHRHPSHTPIPRSYTLAVERYVKLADKLDGLWQEHSSQGGLEKIIERLDQDQSLATRLLTQWEAVDIYDPHHPFLLDELQRALSGLCSNPRYAGIPPLIETHQDGRLFMLLPKAHAAAIKKMALQRLIKHLPFQLAINVSNRGIPELLNGTPDHEALKTFLADYPRKELGRLFFISTSLVDSVTSPLDSCLSALGLAPRWPKAVGQLRTPYPDPEQLSPAAQGLFLQAAHLVLLLNLKLPVSKKNGLPDYAERERHVLQCLNTELPIWLSELNDEQSRRVLLSLWAVAYCDTHIEAKEAIWGANGLLKQWLEGDEQQAGFNQFLEGEGAQAQLAITRHFSQLLQQQRAHPEDETATGRCLFTDMPASTLMASNLGLYQVKVSAFSGREGKPDSLTAPANGQVPINLISIAEHKLRQEAFNRQGGKPSGVPTLISSPTTTGLFGALTLNNEADLKALSIYDLSRQKIEEGKAAYRGLEVYRYRYRMARLERIPEKIEEQINTLRLILQACLRIGRPIHIFRGLPTPQKAFFYFDAMPSLLKALMGYQALRLEQISNALDQLQLAQTLIETTGLGYDVLNLYAYARTRFSAICLVWCHAHDTLKQASAIKTAALAELKIRMYHDFQILQENQTMTATDGALVRLGQAASQIQRRPLAQASTNEEMLVFNLCMDTAMGLRATGQTDHASLVYGIAGELETNLGRKDKMSASKFREGQTLEIACMNFAAQFVNEVWDGVLQGKPPAQNTRRLLGSVYRMAFLQGFRQSTQDHSTEELTPTV